MIIFEIRCVIPVFGIVKRCVIPVFGWCRFGALKHASNLIYISKSDNSKEVESKVIYSIINKHPKRADHYFIIRVNYDDTPDTLEYRYEVLIPETLYSIDLYLGYRVEPKVSVYLRQIIEDIVEKKEINLVSSYPALNKRNIP